MLADCKGRLDALSSQLRRMDLPSFARTEASLAASSKSRGGPVPSQGATGTGTSTIGAGAPDSLASPRPAVTATRIPGASYSSLGGKKSTGNKEVDLHQQLHEDMTTEILQMAKGLKQNALKFTAKLETQSGALEEAEGHLEANVASAQARNKQAKVFYKRNWATGCKSWLILILVLCIVPAVYIAIKMSYFVGYSNKKLEL